MDCKNLKKEMLKCVKDKDGTYQCKELVEKWDKECKDLEEENKSSWFGGVFSSNKEETKEEETKEEETKEEETKEEETKEENKEDE